MPEGQNFIKTSLAVTTIRILLLSGWPMLKIKGKVQLQIKEPMLVKVQKIDWKFLYENHIKFGTSVSSIWLILNNFC